VAGRFEVEEFFGDPKTELKETLQVDEKGLLELVSRQIDFRSLAVDKIHARLDEKMLINAVFATFGRPLVANSYQ
jgi:hypothetical protein